jgi:hypothetical protein
MGAMTAQKASSVKRRGHERERKFNDFFGSTDYKVNFSGATADNYIADTSLLSELREANILKKDVTPDVSLKGGNTIQIHLGSIPELTAPDYEVYDLDHTTVDHKKTFDTQVEELKKVSFWEKYLKKGNLLCYYNDDSVWTFFDMKEVIDFIVHNTEWRILDTGRLKGDLPQAPSGKMKQIFTHEYRSKKRSFVLGAHGSTKGKQFIDVLKNNINFLEKKTND